MGIVADNHDIVMPRGEQIDQITLEFVGILVFINQNKLESALIEFPDVLMFLQKPQPKRQ